MNKIFLLYIFLILNLCAYDFQNLFNNILNKDYTREKVVVDEITFNPNLKVLDATLYKSKYLSNEIFFPKINLIYQRQLWTNWDSISSRDSIDSEKIQKTALSLEYSAFPYILDIEHWDVHTIDEEIANKNIDKYIKVIQLFKRLRPDLKFGFYGVLPNRDYWTPISNDSDKINEWTIINNRLKRLANYVDVVCPSLYTFYDNMDDWNIYARENIKRAKEYGKPIYAFIWPQFHRSNKFIGGNYLNQEFWLNQLIVLSDLDAIVIWGGWDSSKIGKERKMIWNENDNWWKITKDFIISNNLN